MSAMTRHIAYTHNKRPSGTQILAALSVLTRNDITIQRKLLPDQVVPTPYVEFAFDADHTVRINLTTGECTFRESGYAGVIARVDSVRARRAVNAKLPSPLRVR